MAAPTQQLPPWYTLSSNIFTDPSGSTVTSATLLYLPLTYYGPSIPLNSDWTYGGLTSPASTPPVTIGTTFVTTVTSIATPSPVTSSLSSATSSATPTSTSVSPSPTIMTLPPTSTPSSSTPSSSTPSSSSTSSSTPTPSSLVPFSHSGLSKNALIGVILGAIMGSVVIIFIFLLFLRWRVRRRNPEGEPPTIFSFETPVWAEWHMVENEQEQRAPGEGSPRHSGEEADPFLRRSAAAAGATATPGASGSGTATQPMQQRNERKKNVRLVTVPPSAVTTARVQQGQTATTRAGDNHTDPNKSDTSSTGSGYGSLLEPSPTSPGFPGYGSLLEPSPTSPGFPGYDPYPDRRGHIIPPGDLVRMHEEEEEPADPGSERYSPLLPPPRLVDPGRGVRASYASHKYSASSSSDVEDVPALFTARRVRVQELGPRTSPVHEEADSPTSAGSAGQSGWASGLVSGLGRMSWFKNVDPSSSRRDSRSNSRPGSWFARGLNDEFDPGRSLLGADYKRPSPLRLSLNVPDDRPQSSVRTVSGNSLYYDAVSSLPATPPARLSPLPRALTPSSQTPSLGHGLLPHTQSRLSNVVPTPDEPPTYDDGPTHILDTQSPTQLNLNMTLPPGVDILDIPAPPPVSPFTSTTSSSSMFSPPGLVVALPTPKAPSIGSFLTRTESTDGPVGITVDLLEQDPPIAGDGWRSLAGGMGSAAAEERRTTFGPPQFIRPLLPATPEDASLYSMRSHLSPAHSSAGSAPASARLRSPSRSNSSGPGHSAMLTGSSGSGFSRTGSVTSDGRRRRRAGTAISPTLSAFGQHDRERLPVLHSNRPRSPLGHVRADSGGAGEMGAVDADGNGDVPMGSLMRFPDMPWASGV